MVEDNGAVRRASAGRPRDEQIDAAVIAATLEMLGAEGYAGVSLEGVARRAGTSRPAIYRRWAGRAPLVLAALARHLDVPTPPDTGCTLCDVDESFQVFLGAYTTIRPEDLSALYADCAHDADWRSAYLATIIEPARCAVATTIDRAIARGDLREDIDRELVLDLVASLVHYRAMFGPNHLSESQAGEAIQVLLQGAAADYDALVERSEEIEREQLRTVGGEHVHGTYA